VSFVYAVEQFTFGDREVVILGAQRNDTDPVVVTCPAKFTSVPLGVPPLVSATAGYLADRPRGPG